MKISTLRRLKLWGYILAEIAVLLLASLGAFYLAMRIWSHGYETAENEYANKLRGYERQYDELLRTKTKGVQTKRQGPFLRDSTGKASNPTGKDSGNVGVR